MGLSSRLLSYFEFRTNATVVIVDNLVLGIGDESPCFNLTPVDEHSRFRIIDVVFSMPVNASDPTRSFPNPQLLCKARSLSCSVRGQSDDI